MTENPYSPPTAEAVEDQRQPPIGRGTIATLLSNAKATFLAWERLRVLYVLVLGLLTVLLAGAELGRLKTLMVVAEGAFVANVCFFAGPLVETAIHWLGYDGKWVRWLLFICGMLLSCLLVVATLAFVDNPDLLPTPS